MFRTTLLIALTVLLLSCGLFTQGDPTEPVELPTRVVVQDKPVPSPAPSVTQDRPVPSPILTQPVPSSTPTQSVVQDKLVPSPAPLVTQDKLVPSPTPTQSVVQDRPVQTATPAMAKAYESPVTSVVAQDKPVPSPAPLVTQDKLVPSPTPTQSVAQDRPIPSPTPTQWIVSAARMNPPWAGDSSIGLKAVKNDTVVKATMTSFSSEVVVVTDPFHGGTDNRYSPIVKFNLSVSEYLTGTGPTSTVAILLNAISYETRDEANDKLAEILALRDSQWDSREAVLFMVSDPQSSYGTVLDGLFELDDHFFLSESETFSYDDMYSLHSETHRKWLPAVATTTIAGDAQEFLLDVPPTDATITLGALRKRVSEVAAELAAGGGSDVYKDCLRNKYEHLTNQQNWPGERSRPYSIWKTDHDVVSGMPAGTALDKRQAYGRYPDSGFRLKRWVENRDAALFTYENGVVTNLDEDNDGQFDRITYDIMVTLVRPLIAGEYSFDFKESTPYFQQCNYVLSNPWTVTVTSPEGTLHELYFDPVTVGSTVAADSTNGVLTPASFTGSDGATSTISSISWEPAATSSEPAEQPGVAKVQFITASDPDDLLGDHILDFIEQDGSVSVSLDVFDATLDAGATSTAGTAYTFSWALASQPWESGDELMVRVRKAPLSCRSGTVVPNARTEKVLVGDCEVLLGVRDTLAGTATLNWGLTTSITNWDGVSVGGTPRRITWLQLERESLTGEIPPELGGLTSLTRLDLGGNRLTGRIPPELGDLSKLTLLRLAGNLFTGCVPAGLRDVSDHDLDDVGLADCAPIPMGLSVSLSEGVFTIRWSALDGAEQYRAQYRVGGSESEWSDVGTTTDTSIAVSPEDGVSCDTTHEFRVQARGDGTRWAAEWGEPSDAVSLTTGPCNLSPVFTESGYSFSIAENAPAGVRVGTVSASDPDGDPVSYSISAGNGDGKFSIDASAGRITVAGALDREAVASYTLTVEASDGQGGVASLNVGITAAAPSGCYGGTAVSNVSDNPGLARDCEILLGAKDTLLGARLPR